MLTKLEPDTICITGLDFEHHPPCEGEDHPTGQLGHVPEQPGAFYIISPCCGPQRIQCRGRTTQLKRLPFMICGRCGRRSSTDYYKFVPIENL